MSCARPKDPIAEAFERLCARDGARSLVLGPDRAATLAEVDGLARAAEARLDRARLEPGTPVGVRAADGPGFLAALLACLRAGYPAALLEAGATADETARLITTLDLGGRARLSGYKVPRSVVLAPSIPRTPRGKIDRAALERLSVPAARPHG